MARVIAINLLLIFLPLIIYSAFIILYKQPEDKDQFWPLIPLKSLFAIGFLLMGIFYFTQINLNMSVKDGVYHPATIKDGKIIPGHISPPDSKPAIRPKTKSDPKADVVPTIKPDDKNTLKTVPDQSSKIQPETKKKPETDLNKVPEPEIDEKQI